MAAATARRPSRPSPRVIKGLRAKGYSMVTVPELVLDDPPPRGQRLPDGYVR